MRKIRKRSVAFVAATLLPTGVASTAYATTRPEAVDPAALGGLAVATADYTLGDDVFRVPGFTAAGSDKPAPLELTGRVNYPRKLGDGKFPMVVFGAMGDSPEREPGKCGREGYLDRKLTETQQRTAGVAYMSAFFRRHLAGDERFDPILIGRSTPLSAITQVDVRTG